jgi:deazaflavin-dependent oxidoreductase (nitroreductase family)
VPSSTDSVPDTEIRAEAIKVFRMRWSDRVGDVVFRGLARLGIGPASVLTTTGRRSGQVRRTPVIPVYQRDRMWLVSPYGEVSWLLNVRASGEVSLRHGRSEHSYNVREVTAVEAGPVLKRYVEVASATRLYFRAKTGAPAGEFAAEAFLHPVLELTETASRRMVSGLMISDQSARDMYVGGRGNATARRFARLWGTVFAWGLFPRRWVTMEVPGRRTGRLGRFPLGMADVDGRWFVVSMLGECNWVRNVRAAQGHVVLRHRRARPCMLVEVPVAERGPIIRRYVDKVPGGRPHIPVQRGASLEAFQAIAASYPVFEVQPQVEFMERK